MKNQTPFPKTLCIEPLPGIGDLIWYVPHLRAIADQSPEKAITLLTKKSSLADQLLADEPWCKAFIWLERDRRQKENKAKSQRHEGLLGRWHLGQDLKAHHFHSAWVLHHSTFYHQALWLAGTPQRIGFTFSKNQLWLNKPQVLLKADQKKHPRELMTLFMEKAGLQIDKYNHPISANFKAHQNISSKLGEAPRGKRIVFGIGASEIFKCWPWEKFAELAHNLIAQGHQIILCGGPSETQTSDKILHHLQHPDGLLTATQNPLQETIALMQTCDLYVGNDTSLMNLAVNQRKKAITFFGPTYTVYNPLTIALVSPSNQVGDISVEETLQAVTRNLT